MVLLLDLHAGFLHLKDHLASDVLERVGGRDWKVALLVPRFRAEVGPFLPGVPDPFLGIDEIVAAVAILVIAGLVKDEELRLRPPV